MKNMQQKSFTKGLVEKVQDNGVIMGAIASTESADRDGDVILAKGWMLDTFKKQPRLLWSHDAYSLPIGKVTDIQIQDSKLTFNAEFATKEMNPFADNVYQMMKGGFLNAFSVGFIPHEQDEKGNISKAELLEISVVNIPANPEATMTHEYKSFELELKGMEAKEKKAESDIALAEQAKDMLSVLKTTETTVQMMKTTLNDVVAKVDAITKKGDEEVKTQRVEKYQPNVRKALVLILQAAEVANRLLKQEENNGRR